ncbi:unnamed protein product [Rotaria magnacalcarata]|uniref:F-box domain-containing protein n=5 Tax=Rotaria magnacalcarata TaxID=392030 RepID=A0A816TT37_9BILA|nr:unnamed protein product [Rotaria magnacalcarata]
MNKSTFESLPNEILLIIFRYLSSFQLCQAFLHVKNSRIEHLLTSIRHSLDISSMHYDQLYQFLSNINNDTTKRFTTLIDTLVLRGASTACLMLLNYLEKSSNDNQLFITMILPSIKQLVIFNAENYSYLSIEPLLTPLAFHKNTLQRLHLVFDRPTSYFSILSWLISSRISIHTTILEVEKGYEFYSNDLLRDLNMKKLCWSDTIELSLSIQHSNEIMFLFRKGALPSIEHLNITNEEAYSILPEHINKPISSISFDKSQFNEIVDGTRLKSLFLRYIFLNDLIILMNSLTMPLLEKFILIDLYDHTLDHLSRFQQVCDSQHLPSLKNLYFSFCFPKEIEEAWRISPFSSNGEWPFDNVDHYEDDPLFFDDDGVSFVKRSQFIIYTRPINILLEHKRTLHNHRFATHASMPIITNRRRSLQLTCNEMDNPDQLLKTLQIVGSSHVNKLELIYRDDLINVPMISNYPSSCRLSFNHLRSMTFKSKTERIKEAERVYIVKQILDSSPNLSHIETEWNGFRHCSQRYSNLQHVHLLLERLCRQAKEPFDIDRLNQLAPNLCCLEISGGYLIFNENLSQFIFKIIRRFDQLVYLTLIKNDLYRSKPGTKIFFKERLIEIDNGRLFHSKDIQITFPQLDRLYIWI